MKVSLTPDRLRTMEVYKVPYHEILRIGDDYLVGSKQREGTL